MGDSARPETRDDRAERLAPTAVEWVARLREEDVDLLAAELLDPLPRRDLYALIGLLGGAGDPTQSPEVWWGWARHRDVIEHPSPIVWGDDEVRIEDMTTEQINGLIVSLAAEHRSDDEIAEATGLTAGAVAKRRTRMGVAPGLRRGHVATARAGVA